MTVTGGIPSYLERIDPASSADANIHRLCLTREDFLFREFDLLFNDLFQKKQFYRRLIAVAAEKPVELEDIYRKLNVEKAGYISECIQDLIEAGFLARHHTWNVKTGGPSKRSLIRVIDNYTLTSGVSNLTKQRSSAAPALACRQRWTPGPAVRKSDPQE